MEALAKAAASAGAASAAVGLVEALEARLCTTMWVRAPPQKKEFTVVSQWCPFEINPKKGTLKNDRP